MRKTKAEYDRTFRERHREALAVKKRTYSQVNRDKCNKWNREYKARNRQRLLESKRCAYYTNLELERQKRREAAARRRLNNPEILREQKRRYYQANRLKISSQNHIRRVVIREAPLSSSDLQKIIDRQKNCCAEPSCGKRFCKTRPPQLDHIMPIKLGGRHCLKNLQYLCGHCNLSKRALHPNDWARQQGRLL